MHVIVPMSGEGIRFKSAGYSDLKPLIQVSGRRMIEWVVSPFPKEWKVTFICSQKHLDENPQMRAILTDCAPNSQIIAISAHKKGPVWAVLEAGRVAPDRIFSDEPTLINYCDFTFSWDPKAFESFVARTQCDGAVLSFTGFHPAYLGATCYAYSRHDHGIVREVREKAHFSDDREGEFASTGTYFFKCGSLVQKYFQSVFDEGHLLNGEGYASLAFNPMIRDGLAVRLFEVNSFVPFGTPDDLHQFEYWSRVFGKYPYYFPENDSVYQSKIDFQLLMPMAGKGSRFLSGPPKPLVPVDGKPMYRRAIDYLPKFKARTLVVRSDMQTTVEDYSHGDQIAVLDEITEGQAITCFRALEKLDPKLPLIVSNCDHGMVYDVAKLDQLLSRNPDVVVWGQRGFPGASRSPEAFAYVQSDPITQRVSQVSVKKPISETPIRDSLLIGTFYFKNPTLMANAIHELVKRNIRVNNEFYLDSVLNVCIEQGLEVYAFETDGYLGWGTPDALKEYQFWQELFLGYGSRN